MRVRHDQPVERHREAGIAPRLHRRRRSENASTSRNENRLSIVGIDRRRDQTLHRTSEGAVEAVEQDGLDDCAFQEPKPRSRRGILFPRWVDGRGFLTGRWRVHPDGAVGHWSQTGARPSGCLSLAQGGEDRECLRRQADRRIRAAAVAAAAIGLLPCRSPAQSHVVGEQALVFPASLLVVDRIGHDVLAIADGHGGPVAMAACAWS